MICGYGSAIASPFLRALAAGRSELFVAELAIRIFIKRPLQLAFAFYSRFLEDLIVDSGISKRIYYSSMKNCRALAIHWTLSSGERVSAGDIWGLHSCKHQHPFSIAARRSATRSFPQPARHPQVLS